jgi:hypothetical protein
MKNFLIRLENSETPRDEYFEKFCDKLEKVMGVEPEYIDFDGDFEICLTKAGLI